MVDFFIDRPVLSSVIAILITLVGLISIPILPIAQFPHIAPPTVRVSATYTGASAETVEKTVTIPIEEEINGVEGMTYMQSQSANDGTMGINVTFEVGYDLDIAAVDVQNRVELAKPRLPEEVGKYGIDVEKQSTSLIIAVNFISPDSSRDSLFMSNYIDIHISDVLKRIPGVGSLTFWGQRLYSMRIWMNPDKLTSLGLTATDVSDAISDQNQQIPAGSIGEPPVPAGQQFQYTLNTLGRLSTVEEFENIILRTESDGSIVRIKDVARVELGAESYDVLNFLNGIETVGIGIYQLPGANALDVANQVRETMDELAKSFPSGLEYVVAYDTTMFVKASIREVIITLFEAFGLVFLVVFVFMQNFRATIIPAITIPVSLIGTFALINALGFSINTLTLFGLVLAIGLVVDDAIVVVENVTRIIEEKGLESREAASIAMKEVSGPIVATSLVLMAVFVPVAFFPGITGQLYRQFALTIACAVGISTINALTLSPALCAIFLKEESKQKGWLFGSFNKGFDRFKEGYEVWIGKFMNRWKFVVIAFGLLLVATYIMINIVPTGFLPEEDQGYFIVNVQGPEGSSLQRTTVSMATAHEKLKNISGVRYIFGITGLNFLTQASDSNSGAMFLVLDPWSKRKSSKLQFKNIMASAQKELSKIDSAIFVAFNPPPIQGLSSTGGFQFELQDKNSLGLEELYKVSQDIIKKANASGKLQGVFSSFTSNVPSLFINLDRTKAKSLKIPVSDVFDSLQAYLGSLYVNDFNKFGRVYRVFIQADDEYRNKTDDITRLYTRNENGDMVPLSTLVDIERIVGPETISHYNLYRSAEIDGSPASGVSSGESLKLMEKFADESMPEGMGYVWSGVSYQEIKAGNLAPLIFALSLVFVFLFLAALYESWAMPLMIMLAVPLAILGALVAQHIRGLANDVYCQIGLVLLIGLASKNAILIVAFAKSNREGGMSIYDAAREAALVRLRPILMTAFAFILGVFPLVIASGAGASSRHSLGTAVFGGMIFSTILSLIFVPVFYIIIQSIRENGIMFYRNQSN
ncbi:MAG: multidrug efflux RND transporter permease subunit [Thermodesulfobacteriota bacterium]